MKAVVYSEYGGPEVLRHLDLETPTPKDDEILVRARAAALNPLDWHFMRGMPYPLRLATGGLRKPRPRSVVALDFSGTVEAVGRNVTEFAVGDALFGGQRGALAEYVAILAKEAVRKPANVTFEQAGAAPLAGLTALQALRDVARVQRGHQVLINGAAGGIGTFAVQIAKTLGAEVTGVQSTRNLELVRSLGADYVIDYTKEDFTRLGKRYDAILDNICNHSILDVRRAMTPRGVYVGNSGGTVESGLLVGRMLQSLIVGPFISQKSPVLLTKPNKADLQTLADLIEGGKVTPVIDRCYPFADAAAAMRHLETGHARGKVVITV
jgi:NADPH:quinone reductase-like Zn-dependent oxidoreductase